MFYNILKMLILTNLIHANVNSSELAKPHGDIIITTLNLQIAGVSNEALLPFLNQFMENSLKNKLFQEGKQKLESLGSLVEAIGFFINDNKIKIGGAIFVQIYLYILYKIVKSNSQMKSNDSWSNWKIDLPFEKLTAMPTNNLSKELIIEIQKKYKSQNNNILAPFVEFTNDINKELDNIKSYLKMINYIKSFYVSRFYPINENSIIVAKDKINRLNYLKNVFCNTIIPELKFNN